MWSRPAEPACASCLVPCASCLGSAGLKRRGAEGAEENAKLEKRSIPEDRELQLAPEAWNGARTLVRPGAHDSSMRTKVRAPCLGSAD